MIDGVRGPCARPASMCSTRCQRARRRRFRDSTETLSGCVSPVLRCGRRRPRLATRRHPCGGWPARWTSRTARGPCSSSRMRSWRSPRQSRRPRARRGTPRNRAGHLEPGAFLRRGGRPRDQGAGPDARRLRAPPREGESGDPRSDGAPRPRRGARGGARRCAAGPRGHNQRPGRRGWPGGRAV